MNRRQKGFTVIETLLLLILLSIIGFAGYYVYHSKNNANSSYNDTAKASSSTPVNEEWKTYNGKVSDDAQNPAVYADQIDYSFKYPSSWKFYPIGTQTTSNGQTSSNSFQEIGSSLGSDKNIIFNGIASAENAKDYYTNAVGDQSGLVGPVWQGVKSFTTKNGYSGYTAKLDASTGATYETHISNNKTGLVNFTYGAATASDNSTLQQIFDSVGIP